MATIEFKQQKWEADFNDLQQQHSDINDALDVIQNGVDQDTIDGFDLLTML